MAKKGKNGKEGGGVVAAVTNQGAKFSSDNTPTTTKDSSPNPSPVVSPEINPSSISSNENPIISPMLDAVSATSYATSNSPNTREWARGLGAAMAGSPGNLISLSGESPPTAPSSYEDGRGMRSGWSSPRPAVGFHPTSVSPPVGGRRPLSFHMDNQYSAPDVHHQLAAAAARRSSMHSHYSQVRAASNPPLPHQPQPHFYGARPLDVDLPRQTGMKAGDKGYYFGFDSLSPQDVDRAPGKDSVVLAGYEGGLEVYSVGKRGLESVASLKGLRGGVYHAKVLPWTPENSDLFPLVAAVVHGPNVPPPTPEVNVEGDYDAVSADRSEAMRSVSPEPSRNVGSRATPGFIESYQTTVEVFSLKTGRQVSVLLEAPKIPLKSSISGPNFQPPPPAGAFHIHADEGNVVVSSGVTGECWVYRQTPATDEYPLHFRCHGKLWTTLQQPLKGEAPQEAERGHSPALPRPRPQVAILSVNGRFIAYCPPAPSSQIALRAMVPVLPFGRAPGLASVTPPQLPPANADLDLPLAESVMNKIMRDATQELIQGAKWVGKHGWQAWNNYWNPQQSQQQPQSPTLGAQSWGSAGSARPDPSQFPPTHGAVAQPIVKEPGLVSILDIETFGVSVNPHPITSFAIPHGCSFLSFSPSGLSLFSASSKGDVQSVWDLMRIQHTKSSPLQATGSPSGGPRVRQVAQFTRMTVARIVEVAWTRPNGERLAMVTERGTVHLLDLPSSAFAWPPPRRRRAPETQAAAPEGPAMAVSIASNALSSVRDVARPLINRQRRSNSNNAQPATGSGIGEYATQGGKVIAASISHSLGKTGNAINQLRHTGENRVSLPSSTSLPGPSCVVWANGKRDHSLLVLGGGLVRSFPARSRRTVSGADKKAPRLSRYTDFQVRLLPDDFLSPLARNIIDPDEHLDIEDLDGGNNTMVLHQPKPRARLHDQSAESSIPQAEIESSAPYQPFHTDRRVALYELGVSQQETDLTALMAATSLDETATEEPAPHKKKGSKRPQPHANTSGPTASTAAATGPWVFGQHITATKLDLGVPQYLEEDSFSGNANIPLDASRALPASAMERIMQRGGEGDEQIVVTTRRRRGAAPNAEDDGFFEDDCEVLDFADQRV
ncbi:hypothetical protein B0J18DRAFT_198182 [Chaetomium sp. MPI-SDFR-AT-0129]|nr:hypothetical protein B0J18DRAFT_198182 [Chaetomium sp. MPI-SDFR-AT-0129]